MEDSGRALEDDTGTVRSAWRFLLAGFEIITLFKGLAVDDEGVDEDAIDNVGLWVAVIIETCAGLGSRKGSTVGWVEEAAISRVPKIFSLIFSI